VISRCSGLALGQEVQELAYRAILNLSQREETKRRQKAVRSSSSLLAIRQSVYIRALRQSESDLRGVIQARGSKLLPRGRLFQHPSGILEDHELLNSKGKLNLQFNRRI
jgi:hypothetical protein